MAVAASEGRSPNDAALEAIRTFPNRNAIFGMGEIKNADQAKSAIDTAMLGKGMQMVPESQNPDLILTASGGMKQETSYTAYGMRGFGGGMGGITPEQNVIGTMIVDLYDAKNKSLVWRGIAQNTLSNNGNKNSQMVSKAVQKMFKQWPTA